MSKSHKKFIDQNLVYDICYNDATYLTHPYDIKVKLLFLIITLTVFINMSVWNV
jgi:hypothetical protein